MSPTTKGCTSTFIIVALTIAGFIFGFRSCLSKYDERSALAPVLYFKNDSSCILFSIIKYSRTNSYERTPDFTRKTVTDIYYIQNNNALTGEKINSKEITSDIKNYPVKVLGSEENKVWVFLNELMAFDAFSLEKVADVKMIEAKYPFLKGRMPMEREFYEFNEEAQGIVFKANNGTQWVIHLNALIAMPYEPTIKLDNKTDLERTASQLQDRLKNLQKTDLEFNQLKVNQDTLKGQWLGIYSKEEINSINTLLSFTSQNGQYVRRQFYNANYDSISYQRFAINNIALQNSTEDSYYLNGGFLVDKQTGKAISLHEPNGYLVIHKQVIGQEGSIIISRNSIEGRKLWELNTSVSKWVDYKYSDNKLFIYASNNKEIGSGECSFFMIVDCKFGKVYSYDYFTDKIRN